MSGKPRPFAVLFKALSLFVLINFLYGLVSPPIQNVSAYNTIFPGLERMPFGDDLSLYSVSIDNADVMFAAHEISAEKGLDELRVPLVGDSSIWGEGLTVEEPLPGNGIKPACNAAKEISVFTIWAIHILRSSKT